MALCTGESCLPQYGASRRPLASGRRAFGGTSRALSAGPQADRLSVKGPPTVTTGTRLVVPPFRA